MPAANNHNLPLAPPPPPAHSQHRPQIPGQGELPSESVRSESFPVRPVVDSQPLDLSLHFSTVDRSSLLAPLPLAPHASSSLSTTGTDRRVHSDGFCPDRYREQVRQRAAVRRANMTPEQRAQLRLAENEARRQRQRDETQEEIVFRRAASLARVNRHNLEVSSLLFRKAFSYDPQIDYSSHPLISIGFPSVVCRHCSAKCFQGETKGMCCADGKVRPPQIEQPPEPVLSLFSGLYPESVEFLKHIRTYNSCFSMTSFGVSGQRDDLWSTFRIQGQIYHRIGSVLPVPEAPARFLQVYFMGDSNVQVDHRCSLARPIYRDVKRHIVAHLQKLLDDENILIQRFRTSLDRMPSDSYAIKVVGGREPQFEHRRRYNAPVEEEVSAVIVDNPRGLERDIIIQRRNAELIRIRETHPSYDALQYPLIFWRGSDSYRIDYKMVNPDTGAELSKNASCMNYYAHQIMIREDHQNFLLKCGKLFSQFLVDMYAKIESERLRYFRANQTTLRAELYQNLRDAMSNDGNAEDVGRPHIILPSTFIGGPRHMHEYAQDGMALIRCFGRPDLFITFTCNAKWKEITDLLLPSQTAADRHDLTSRVFKRKLAKLIYVIRDQGIFGKCRGYIYTIEWQKRGLPHAHILIWLEERLRPENIDSIICAEIPDPTVDPKLHLLVKKHLVHGPCGHENPRCVCMVDGRCEKKFPRAFIDETQSDNDGYPLYRRRSSDNGGNLIRYFVGNEAKTIDNRWIVPHSPILTRMFEAHINVEYCHSVNSVKYICKYIHKGSDRAIIRVGNDRILNRNDEIEVYQSSRYLCSSEAVFRILRIPVHEREPNVEHLAVHLENGQRVYYREGQAPSIAQNPKNTTLLAFFELCKVDELAKTLYYLDIPKFYSWQKNHTWKRRGRGQRITKNGFSVFSADTVARLYTVHPNNQDCFYLRILLTKVVGPTCFEDLRRFEGRLYPNYREACIARGLLENDQQWDHALGEAITCRMPAQIRSLFATILCSCQPSDPILLWEKYKKDMSEDILNNVRRLNPTSDIEFTDAIFNQALILIEDDCIARIGLNLAQFGLLAPQRNGLDLFNSEIVRETSYSVEEMLDQVSSNLASLVPDQRLAFNAIVEAVQERSGGLFFIDAPGGTGKTFLLNLILAQIRSRGEIVVACASSGIAATLLSGGRTAHSAFKIPLTLNAASVCAISRGTSKARMLRECRAIIWDECTMVHKHALDAVDRTLRDIRGVDELFGGIVMVLAGDFRQTLPVIPRSTPADELNACLKQSELWCQVQKFKLTTNMRVHLGGGLEAQSFADKLLTLGDGTYPLHSGSSFIKLTSDWCNIVLSLDSLIDRVFPNLENSINNYDWLAERAILAPTNMDVNDLNSTIQNKLCNTRSCRTYFSIDQTKEPEESVHFPTELLNAQSPSGFPPHELILKVGSPIMVLRNLKGSILCNGTRMVVLELQRNLIKAQILTGVHKGVIEFIPRIRLDSDDTFTVPFRRTQFPVRLCFAMTINKSQGQTLKVAGLNLTTPCFSHGQFYVACSRVGNPCNLYIFSPDSLTRNVVYPSALR